MGALAKVAHRVLGEGRRKRFEAWSSSLRLAPSTGVQGSNGILGPGLARLRPRLDKREHGRRLRGSPPPSSEGGTMFAGIDIASERHVLARLETTGAPIGRPTGFLEDRAGYDMLLAALGTPPALIVMEATGHYWKNLF